MRKSFLSVVFVFLFVFALVACAEQSDQEAGVARNTAQYQRLKSIATGVKMTDDEIDAIIRTMLPDGSTASDMVSAAGYAVEQSEPDDLRLTCFLMESTDSFTLYFDSGLGFCTTSGKIVVESERQAIRKLYRDLVAAFQYDAAAYMPPDSLRMICLGDNGSPSDEHTYYYDPTQYIAVLNELFHLPIN